MRDLTHLDQYRKPFFGMMGDEHNGAFEIEIGKQTFYIIASNGGGWDHVSITPKTAERCPKWNEMCTVKDLFFKEDEEVMQLHPAKENHINNHPYCLHLWRPQKEKIPLPPRVMV